MPWTQPKRATDFWPGFIFGLALGLSTALVVFGMCILRGGQ